MRNRRGERDQHDRSGRSRGRAQSRFRSGSERGSGTARRESGSRGGIARERQGSRRRRACAACRNRESGVRGASGGPHEAPGREEARSGTREGDGGAESRTGGPQARGSRCPEDRAGGPKNRASGSEGGSRRAGAGRGKTRPGSRAQAGSGADQHQSQEAPAEIGPDQHQPRQKAPDSRRLDGGRQLRVQAAAEGGAGHREDHGRRAAQGASAQAGGLRGRRARHEEGQEGTRGPEGVRQDHGEPCHGERRGPAFVRRPHFRQRRIQGDFHPRGRHREGSGGAAEREAQPADRGSHGAQDPGVHKPARGAGRRDANRREIRLQGRNRAYAQQGRRGAAGAEGDRRGRFDPRRSAGDVEAARAGRDLPRACRPRQDDAHGLYPQGARGAGRGRRHHPADQRVPGRRRGQEDHLPRHARPCRVQRHAGARRADYGYRRPDYRRGRRHHAADGGVHQGGPPGGRADSRGDHEVRQAHGERGPRQTAAPETRPHPRGLGRRHHLLPGFGRDGRGCRFASGEHSRPGGSPGAAGEPEPPRERVRHRVRTPAGAGPVRDAAGRGRHAQGGRRDSHR